jgi:hypothetical protein
MSFTVLRIGLVVARFGMDGDVVHIYREPSLGHLSPEYRVHHHLKGGWRVGETEEHDCGFEKPLWSKEGSFPLITVFDTDIVVSPPDIELSEQRAATEVIDCLWNERGDIAILLSPLINWSVVLYWP